MTMNESSPHETLGDDDDAKEKEKESSESTSRRALSRDISTSNHHTRAPLGDLGRKSKTVSCPFCHHTETTKTRHTIGRCSIIWAIALLLIFWPLCWVPLVLPWCKLTSHFCPNCFEKNRSLESILLRLKT